MDLTDSIRTSSHDKEVKPLMDIEKRLETINRRIDSTQPQIPTSVILPFETHEVRNKDIRPVERLQKKHFYCICKRLFDFVASLSALVILAIPMIVISIAIRIESKGPAVFRQIRLGKYGKPFHLLKFRSMKLDAENMGAQWAVSEDPRVTKLGRFLRLKRLDELPQLINIVLGQMSIVGPRPERPVYYKEFRNHFSGFEQRLLVIPGLTGWAQINGGYNILPDRKAELDMDYIENRSFKMDLAIIFKTLRIVITHDGAR